MKKPKKLVIILMIIILFILLYLYSIGFFKTKYQCLDGTWVYDHNLCNKEIKLYEPQPDSEATKKFYEDLERARYGPISEEINEEKPESEINCNTNEFFLEKTYECYNNLDKILPYNNGKVTTICSYPCPLNSQELEEVNNKIKNSYSFIKDVVEIEPTLEVEVRVNEKDPKCSVVYGWRLTKFENQVLVICPNQIESEGRFVFPKNIIEHELVHAFLEHRIGCLSFNEGLAKYITEHLDKPDFFDSHDTYYLFKSGNLTIVDIRDSHHLKGFFFFLNLDEKVIFQKPAIRTLFNIVEDKNDADCDTVRNYIGNIVEPSVVNELYQKYEIN